jgi:hypothetical protein
MIFSFSLGIVFAILIFSLPVCVGPPARIFDAVGVKEV